MNANGSKVGWTHELNYNDLKLIEFRFQQLNIFIMKTIRRISENPFMITLMISLVLFVSCGKEEIINNVTNNQNALFKSVPASITGEDLFRSIIFADGPVTNQLGQLDLISEQIQNFSSEDIATYRESQAKVIQHIQSEDQFFFDQFKEDILSGDAKVISEALRYSAEKIHSYTKAELANENIDIEEYFQEFDGDLDLSDYDNVTYGVGLWFVVTVVVALFIVINIMLMKQKIWIFMTIFKLQVQRPQLNINN